MPELTEEQIREIVREEMRRIIACWEEERRQAALLVLEFPVE